MTWGKWEGKIVSGHFLFILVPFLLLYLPLKPVLHLQLYSGLQIDHHSLTKSVINEDNVYIFNIFYTVTQRPLLKSTLRLN